MRALGAIELGGTTTRWGVGDDRLELTATGSLATGEPGRTIASALAALTQAAGQPLAALGVGAFGPLDLRSGTILPSPKAAWTGTGLRELVRAHLDVPIALETDVGAAALGEGLAGAARGAQDFVYLTVGTGIGGAAVAGGRLVHGDGHAEMGHVRLPVHAGDREEPAFAGVCAFHGDCLEGMASGPAIAARHGVAAEELDPDDPAWEREAHYLGLAVANLVHTLRPQRIVIGGGVMAVAGLRERVRLGALAAIGGYLDVGDGAQLVLAPGLRERSALVGCLALARDGAGPTSEGGST